MPTDIVKDFLENIPPYKKIEFNIGIAEVLNKRLPKLELFCLTCNKERAFKGTKISYGSTQDLSFATKQKFAPSNYGNLTGIAITEICFEYSCSFCNGEYYYNVIIDDGEMCKIGQYPSFAELSHKDVEKYKNVLSKYYIEFKRSLSAYSQGMGVASFVYLRRILEDIVEKKYNKLENKSNEIKFLDKLKCVEKTETIIPEEISSVKTHIYSILSKGVHEYSEEECMEMYASVKFIIELILDKQLEEKARKDKIKNCSSILIAKKSEKTADGK